MEKVAGHPRLSRRGATYYHRAAIPVDIVGTYPKSEETFSLRTKNREEAVKLVRIEAARVDRLFDEHRRQRSLAAEPPLAELTAEQVKRIGEAYYAHLLDEDEDTRLGGFAEASFEESATLTEDLDALNRRAYARGEADAFFEGEAEEVLGWENVNLRLDPASPSWRRVARELQAASVRAAEAIRARNRGDVVETPQAPAAPPQAAPVSAGQGGSLLSHLVKDWATEKARASWVPKTEHEHRVWMGHFISMTGDRPLAAYGKAEAVAFKRVLMGLPANWSKLGPLRGQAVQEAAERARELGLAPMSDKNLNKLLGYVGSFWTWAAKHFDDCPPNPFRGLKVDMRKRNVRDDRDPFTLAELRAIFSAPLYTGCASAREWATAGALVPRDAGRYWVPLVCLFSGARSGEIIQLYTADVREEHGVQYFDINGEGPDKRLKTPNSKRNIPVHPRLVELGFMEHVERRRKAGERRLFPELPMGADGYYSSPFSKHYGRFLKSVGVKTRKNAFHSFRHSFEDACRDSDIATEVMDALQGHGAEGMKARYGKGFFLKKLGEAMARLRYEGLDLSHLRPASRVAG
jgi:integrase